MAKVLQEGDTLPKWKLPDENGDSKKFADLCGTKGLIIYVYPKDNTPGCTMESQDFTARIKDFRALGFAIVGLSKDTSESHTKFIEKCSLGISLLSDTEGELIKSIGAWGQKNNYGKISTGIIRSTFIIDKKETLLKIYRNVKATGHAEKVLKELKTLL